MATRLKAMKVKRGNVSSCPSLDVVTSLAALDIPLHREYALSLAMSHNGIISQTEVVKRAGIQAILSINAKLGPNMKSAKIALDNLDSIPYDSAESTEKFLRSKGLHGMGVWYRGICSWLNYCENLGDGICLQYDETWENYRDRLCVVASVQYKIASFIALLAYPLTSDLTVCDRWILVAVGLLNPSESTATSGDKKKFLTADRILRDKAKQLGYTGPMGIFHWALWNYLRRLGGADTTHESHEGFQA